MLKQGAFFLNGTTYDVYELDTPGFYRLDICERGAQFHIDADKVLYSIVRQKATRVYGDSYLYQKLQELMEASLTYNGKVNSESKWMMGKYYTTVTKGEKDSAFYEEDVSINGRFSSRTLQARDMLYTIQVTDERSNNKLRPLNFRDYEEIVLGTAEAINTKAPYYSLPYLKAHYDIEHLEACDYVVADTEAVAIERLTRWLEADVPLKGVDTETTGVNIDLYGEDKMVGVILSYAEDESTYFPFGHALFPNLSEDFLQQKLMPAIKHEEDKLAAHNKKFERKVFLHLGWSIYIKYDTLPLSFMVNPVISKGAHALKDLMFRATGKTFLELENIFTSSKLIDFSVLPKDIVRLYACPDASSVIYLFKYLWKKLPVYSRKLTEVEFALADVKADQEYYGLRVDEKKFNQNLQNCDFVIDVLLRAFRTLTHKDININSSQNLSELIYGEMGCPVLVRTKTGKPSTGAASIKKLASMKLDIPREQQIEGDLCDMFGKPIITAKALNEAKYPALVVLEKYRVYNKLKTAFYNRFLRTDQSGRVFFWINQNGATSGRQSSPMHQLPPELKDIILPDTPEHDMWDPDYSQIELRMIAFLAGESELVELCKDPENDIHRAIGSLISNKEMWEISSEERKVGKRRNFGVVYMISAYGLAGQIAGAGYTSKDVETAQKSLDEFYARFKRIKRYIAQNAEKVKNQGYITTFFGRTKYFKEIFSDEITSRKKASILRQANNLPVQGTAADYLKLAETNFNAYIRNKGWDKLMDNGFPRVRIALSIHDEVLLMADRSIPYEEIILMIRTCMEMTIKDAPPFFCSPALVETWAQHDDDSVAMPVLLRDQLIADYQKTGISKLNKDNYMEVLNKYRDDVLHNYMRGLIQQYGNDPDAVAEHVRHPSLTHELIARYPAPRGSGLDHVGSIRYAVEAYMKGEDISSHQEPEKETVAKLENIDSLQTLINFDAEGNVQYDDPTEAEEEEAESSSMEDHEVFQITESEKNYVWKFLDSIYVDISDLTKEHANAVIAKVWEHREENGFYPVKFCWNNRVVDGNFYVEDIDAEEIADFIKQFA